MAIAFRGQFYFAAEGHSYFARKGQRRLPSGGKRARLFQKQEEPWNAVNSILLNRAYLRSMVSSKQELRLLRNKILAYHGYRFQSKDLQDYFAGISWYKPGNDNNAIKLDIIEQTNIQLIKSEEAERTE